MPPIELVRRICPSCSKAIGVRPDQIGRRVRCPSCKGSFSIEPDPVAAEDSRPAYETVPTGLDEASDANEMIPSHRPYTPPVPQWPLAKLSGSFQHLRDIVFRAAVNGVRACQGDIVSIDHVNHYLSFTIQHTDGSKSSHNLFTFDGKGGSDVEIRSQDPNINYQFDATYQTVFQEMGKFLMYSAPVMPAPPMPHFPPAPVYYNAPPPAAPPAPQVVIYNNHTVDSHDDYVPRRRRSSQGADGLSIAGFICGVLGLVFFCVPFMGGGFGLLAVLFGGIGLTRKKPSGFAVASLTLGLIACVVSLVVLLSFVRAR